MSFTIKQHCSPSAEVFSDGGVEVTYLSLCQLCTVLLMISTLFSQKTCISPFFFLSLPSNNFYWNK